MADFSKSVSVGTAGGGDGAFGCTSDGTAGIVPSGIGGSVVVGGTICGATGSTMTGGAIIDSGAGEYGSMIGFDS